MQLYRRQYRIHFVLYTGVYSTSKGGQSPLSIETAKEQQQPIKNQRIGKHAKQKDASM
jgi:hypothetical protein